MLQITLSEGIARESFGKVILYCPHEGCDKKPLTNIGIYCTVRQVVDIFKATETLLQKERLALQHEAIRGISSGYPSGPLHTVYLTSDLVSGLVKVGIQPMLSFEGVHHIPRKRPCRRQSRC